MADHYVKLWASILHSSIWSQPLPTRVVWITMLAMADEHGFVGASVDGIARLANVSMDEAQAAITELANPDQLSRSSEEEGRRIRAVPRGWHIINHGYFKNLRDREERREYERIRKAEQRARKRGPGHVPDGSGTSPRSPALSAHASESPDESPDVPQSTEAPAARRGGADQKGKAVKAPSSPPEPRSPSKAPERPDGLSDRTWADWKRHRASCKAPITETVIDGFRREAALAGLSFEEAVQTSVTQGWRGFRADWMVTRLNGSSRQTTIVPKIIPAGYYAGPTVEEM